MSTGNSIAAALVVASLGAGHGARRDHRRIRDVPERAGIIDRRSHDRGRGRLGHASSVGDTRRSSSSSSTTATDPSAATRNARKLIRGEKVDLLIGTATAPSSIAPWSPSPTAQGADERDLADHRAGDRRQATAGAIAMPQPPSLMGQVVVDRMKRDGIKRTSPMSASRTPGATWSTTAQKPAGPDG